MIRRPPRSTLTDTLFPYTTLFRSTVDEAADVLTIRRGTRVEIEVPLSLLRVYRRHDDLVPRLVAAGFTGLLIGGAFGRSEEHTSELQSLMRISYAVFCLKKKNRQTTNTKLHRRQPRQTT